MHGIKCLNTIILKLPTELDRVMNRTTIQQEIFQSIDSNNISSILEYQKIYQNKLDQSNIYIEFLIFISYPFVNRFVLI